MPAILSQRGKEIMNIRRVIAASLAVLSMSVTQLAVAQVQQLEEVVVTAQRRSENIQNVPVSVTAVTGDTLDVLGAKGVEDLASTAPGLYIGRQLASPLIYIRGIGTTSTQGGQESPSAMYVDGVYYAELPGLNFSFNNIDRIEVLKGPQGTLFGRNATGGLVQIVTKDPTHEKTAKFGMTAGNYQSFGGKFYATGGVSDTIAADIAVVGNTQEKGWGRNTFLNIDTGYNKDMGVRSTWLLTPSEKTTIRTSIDWASMESTVGVSRQASPGAFTVDGMGPSNSFYDERSNFRNFVKSIAKGAAVKVTHSYANTDLVSITAYRKNYTHLQLDQDSTSIPLVNAPIFYDDTTFSQELQLLSTGDSRVQWIAGLYYIKLDFDYELDLHGAAFAALGGVDNKHTQQPVTSYAGYAQSTIAIGAASHVTIGGRYTSDTRKFTGRDAFGNGLVVPVSATRPKTTTSDPTWRLAYDHRFSEQLMGFASYNKGFKSGLYNMVNLSQNAVNPERVNAYEVGLKSDLLGRRVRLNASAFYYDYTDLQIQVISAGLTVLSNAAKAKVQGLELELQAAATDRLTLYSGLSFLDAKYKNFPNAQLTTRRLAAPFGNAVTTGSATGNDLNRAPRSSGALALDYKIPTGSGTWALNGSYVYTGAYFWEPDNRLKQPGVGLLNAQLGWSNMGEKLRVYAFGRNLTNEVYSQFVSGGTFGDVSAPAAPRTVGIGVDFNFK
jgi:iron complex outermembrane receptor protein